MNGGVAVTLAGAGGLKLVWQSRCVEALGRQGQAPERSGLTGWLELCDPCVSDIDALKL